jgi:hypothetical protein
MKTMGILLAIFLVLAASARGAERYRWPLDAERRLSSSFGEYREGHYHAGIDLRTFGEMGLPCRAPDRCEVARLRVAPTGYGKAVYLRLADGTEAVYGHLSDFNRTLDSLAYEWRIAHRTNWCDIVLQTGGPRFGAGEIVAYTGRSGSSHPHLHYELRDAAERPYNPLVSRYEVPDAAAPVLAGLEAVPVTWGSLVDGAPLAVTRRFRVTGKNRYAVVDTLMLDGVFGFGVSAWDKQDHAGYRLGPYEVTLSIDGARVYHVANNRFDYAQIGDVVLEYDEMSTPPAGHYLLLFKKPGNVMENRDGLGLVGPSGRADSARAIPLADGPHEGLIAVRDAAGNESRGRFAFVMRANPPAAVPGGSNVGGRLEPQPDGVEGDTVACAIRLDPVSDGVLAKIVPARILASPPVMLIGAPGADSLRVFPNGPREHVAFIPAGRLSDGVNVIRVLGRDRRGSVIDRAQAFYALVLQLGRSGSFHASDSVVVSLRAQSGLGPTTVIVGGAPGKRRVDAGLVPLANPFSLDFPLDRVTHPIRVSLAAAKGAGLFQWQGRAGWRCLGVPEPGGAVDLRRPGVYAVFRDVKPPALKGVGYSRRAGGSGFFKRKLCEIPVREDGSGVDPDAVVVTIDGELAIGEWDEYRGRLEIPIPASYRRGQARLEVALSDRAGNRAAGQYTIVIE